MAVVEKHLLGGTCLNYGCIPTKALISSARAASMARSLEAWGVRVGEVEIDYPVMAARKDKAVTTLRRGVEGLLKARGVKVLAGEGRLTGPHAVEVTTGGDQATLEAANIIIATGSEAVKPPVFGFDGRKVLTSQDAVMLTDIGKSVIIVGGGYIGCEYASLYAHLGLDVTILELLPSILTTQDADVVKEVARSFRKRKIKTTTGVRVESLAAAGRGVTASLEGGEEVTADFALVAVGRKPLSANLGLEEAGVAAAGGFVEIDEHCRTNVDGIFAIGDVTGKMLLAHVASRQGIVAAENACGLRSTIDYDVVPACIFTDPEAASVGLTEGQAQEKGLSFRVGKFPFRALGKAQAEGRVDGMVKLIGEAESGRLLGAHIVGQGASDLIAETALAMKTGATIGEIAETIHAHPTLPEAVKEAAEAFEGKAIHIL
ncbi:MAG: dihydrolipoyl dehydrogenase [Planctomycetes bacterium]|nr:dihydrolipoyl dehydrogenase [Planctomycetota bacterium]